MTTPLHLVLPKVAKLEVAVWVFDNPFHLVVPKVDGLWWSRRRGFLRLLADADEGARLAGLLYEEPPCRDVEVLPVEECVPICIKARRARSKNAPENKTGGFGGAAPR